MRRLFFLIDGTWNSVIKGGNKNVTNIYRMSQAIAEKDQHGNDQITFYFPGVGTRGFLDKWIGGIFAEGLEELILEAYINLVSNYRQGDRIYIIGFSRGAFAAQVLAQLICNHGLLKLDHSHHINRIWAAFLEIELDGFQKEFINNIERYVRSTVTIDFVGLFDSVIARNPKRIAGLDNSKLGDLRLPSGIKRGFHILALDETRKAFMPVIWRRKDNQSNQCLDQVWMPGVHGDIGGFNGGSLLSDWSLLLMLSEIKKIANVTFDQNYLKFWQNSKYSFLQIPPSSIIDKIFFRNKNRKIGSKSPDSQECLLDISDQINGKTVNFKGKFQPYLLPKKRLNRYNSHFSEHFKNQFNSMPTPSR